MTNILKKKLRKQEISIDSRITLGHTGVAEIMAKGEEGTKHAQETEEMFIVLPHIELYTCRIEDYTYPVANQARSPNTISKEGRLSYSGSNKGDAEGELLFRTVRQ
jgi:hypothetical protein